MRQNKTPIEQIFSKVVKRNMTPNERRVLLPKLKKIKKTKRRPEWL